VKDEPRLPVPTEVAIARLESLREALPSSDDGTVVNQSLAVHDESVRHGGESLADVKVASAGASPLRLTPANATDRFQRILRGEPVDEGNSGDESGEAGTARRTMWAGRQDAQESDDSKLDRLDIGIQLQQSFASRAREFTKDHLAVILVFAVVAAVFTVSQVLRARSQEVPLAPPTVVTSGSAEPIPEATPQVIQVHILGAVVTPGVVVLPLGARVYEAIAACGGMSADADPAELNLAAVLSDGAQVIIGVRGAPQGEVVDPGGTSGQGTAANGKVNLNTATSAQLETLPGIGPVTAGKIIAWRTEHGKFSSTVELQEVSGIGAKTYAQLEPYVCV
jgi:competence protein ComEA